MLALLSGSAEIIWQVTSYGEISELGSLTLIHGKVTTSPSDCGTAVQRGSFNATPLGEFARRLLLCVVAVSRPLRIEELAEFLAFDFKAGQIPTFRKDWHLEDPVEAVLSTCSTLLSLSNVENSQVIQFSHFSVKEFLTSTRFAEK